MFAILAVTRIVIDYLTNDGIALLFNIDSVVTVFKKLYILVLTSPFYREKAIFCPL